MSTLNHNWLNAQASRRYPLDDNATGTGDDGTRLKDDIIVDMHLRWPQAAGQYAFIGGITVTENILTVVVLAADSVAAAADFTPLASVTIQQPANRHQYYNFDALYPGTGGFIAFGDVSENFNIRFSTPAQGLIAPKVGRPYTALPIPTMRKLGRADGLTGLVKILAGSDLEIVKETVNVEGTDTDAMVIRLLNPISARTILADYIGPCGVRPESRNCKRPGIETVNGVSPDCNGNLNIDFQGLVTSLYDSCGSLDAGIVIDQSLGIGDVCTSRQPRRFQGTDYCPSSESSLSSIASGSLSSSSLSSAGSGSASLSSASSEVCELLPFQDCFEGTIHESWYHAIGTYGFVEDDSPAGGGFSCSSSALTQALRTTDGSRRNILVWQDCAVATSDAKIITTHLKLTNLSSKRNGGVLINYHTADPVTNPHIEYFAAQIDQNNNRVELLRFNGLTLVLENSVTPALPFSLNDWYQIRVTTAVTGPGAANISVQVINTTNPAWPTVSFTVPTTQWDSNEGFFGLHTDRGITDYSFWRIEDA